jgi:hypothetical protein
MALVHGMIIKGDMCPYVDECGLSDVACNGKGCPFGRGETSKFDFSCGAARFFELCEKLKENEEDEI